MPVIFQSMHTSCRCKKHGLITAGVMLTQCLRWDSTTEATRQNQVQENRLADVQEGNLSYHATCWAYKRLGKSLSAAVLVKMAVCNGPTTHSGAWQCLELQCRRVPSKVNLPCHVARSGDHSVRLISHCSWSYACTCSKIYMWQMQGAYLLGLKGPAQCVKFDDGPMKIHLVPSDGSSPMASYSRDLHLFHM